MRFARWFTLVLFATVSVLGHGLHLLVDGAGPAHQGCCAVPVAAADACCGHAHPDTRSCREDVDLFGGRVESRHDPHACPICQFLTQGQVLTRPVTLLDSQFARPHCPGRAPLDTAAPSAGAYQARAPPTLV